jgi:hypothetical protein
MRFRERVVGCESLWFGVWNFHQELRPQKNHRPSSGRWSLIAAENLFVRAFARTSSRPSGTATARVSPFFGWHPDPPMRPQEFLMLILDCHKSSPEARKTFPKFVSKISRGRHWSPADHAMAVSLLADLGHQCKRVSEELEQAHAIAFGSPIVSVIQRFNR